MTATVVAPASAPANVDAATATERAPTRVSPTMATVPCAMFGSERAAWASAQRSDATRKLQRLTRLRTRVLLRTMIPRHADPQPKPAHAGNGMLAFRCAEVAAIGIITLPTSAGCGDV